MTGYELNDKGVANLITAIGTLAVSDYKFVSRLMSRSGWQQQREQVSKGSKDYELRVAPEKVLAELEVFFLGGWFEMLSGIDGAMILERIAAERQARKRVAKKERCSRMGTERRHKSHAPGSGRLPSTDYRKLAERDMELAQLLHDNQITREQLAREMKVEYRTLVSLLNKRITDNTVRRIRTAAESLISKRTR